MTEYEKPVTCPYYHVHADPPVKFKQDIMNEEFEQWECVDKGHEFYVKKN